MKREAYEKQQDICPKCGKHFEIEEMQQDHITPRHKAGKTDKEDCQMLCKTIIEENQASEKVEKPVTIDNGLYITH